jgi:hypothetical protein
MWERLSDVVALGKRRGVSITCNGDGDGWSNWERIRSETGERGTRIVLINRRGFSHARSSGGKEPVDLQGRGSTV